MDYSSRFRILKGGKISLVVSALLGSVTLSFASPTGGTVASGSATISQNGNITNIIQSTQKASINWQNFSIASHETVNFNQPNSSSITLNRVIGNERSVIDGALNANGQVWLLNSNGVLFGKNASINTSGILATTAQLSDTDFQNGNYNFTNAASESIINEGTITISDGGSVILASNEVRNSGAIEAIKGKVYLVGADSYSLNLNGNSLVNLKVNKGVLDALVENSGTIIADGGEIYLTANAVNELLKGVVNNTGIIEANSLDGITGKVQIIADEINIKNGSKITAIGTNGGGEILIGGGWQGSGDLKQAVKVTMESGATIDASATEDGDGGKVVLWSDIHNVNALTYVNGTIKAQGGVYSGDGGKIETSGANLNMGNELIINAGTTNGESGLWLIDPYDYAIDATAATNIVNALVNNNVTVTTANDNASYGSTGAGGGNLNINSAINSGSGNELSLIANGDISVNAAISVGGNLNLQGNNLNQSAAISTSGALNTISVTVNGDINVGSTLHSAGNINLTAPNTMTLNQAVTADGDISLTATNIAINNQLGSAQTNTMTLNASGSVTDGASGYIIAPRLLVSDGTVVLDNVNNDVDIIAGKDFDSLTLIDKDDLEVGTTGVFTSVNGLTSLGAINVSTKTGDLTISQNISGTSVTLNAGKDAAAGTSTGGNIKVNGTPSITASTGNVKLYTGSISGSVNLASLISAGKFRYNSDESTTNYTTALGATGTYAIYREQPTASITANDKTITYGTANPTYNGSETGVVNGDESLIAYTLTGGVNSTAGKTKAGTYTIDADGSALTNLGYSITQTDGTLTVNKKDVTVTYSATNKTYDGSVSATVTESASALVTNDVVSISESASFNTKNVGTNKTVNISSITLGGADAGNYNLTSTTATTTADITRLNSVTWIGGATGNWFDPANWAGGAVPDLSNVANVVIPTGTVVTFDTTGAVNPADSSSAVNIDSLGTLGSLTMTDGTLNVANDTTLNTFTQNGGTLTAGNITLDTFAQTAGTTSTTGNFTVNDAFSQGTSGSISVGGNTSITDTTGGVVIGNLNTTGTTSITSNGGDITQANGATIVSGGIATLDAGTNDIILNNANNDFQSTVNATGNNIAIAKGNEERNTVLIEQIITPIANATAIPLSPKIEIKPTTETTVTKSIVLVKSEKQVKIISQPIQNQNTRMVSMGELKAETDDGLNTDTDMRVPISDGSKIELVNGGVRLPVGVEQQFFVVVEKDQGVN